MTRPDPERAALAQEPATMSETQFDTWGTSDLVCPFCGFAEADIESESYSSLSRGTKWECARCETEFDAQVEFTPSFSSWKPTTATPEEQPQR